MLESTSQKYDWSRTWIPNGTTSRPDHLGFPSYVQYDQNFRTTKLAKTLVELANIPCLILLGEPGSGKTTEVNRIKHEGALTQTSALNRSSSETELFGSITSHAIFNAWERSDQSLYLYLDGLDEALLNISSARHVVVSWLDSNAERFGIGSRRSKKIYLRITCRSAIWLGKTQNELSRLFGESNVAVYELASLSQEQIRIAAQHRGIDPEEFVRAIVDRELIAMTTEPVSLNFLLDAFKIGMLSGTSFDEFVLFREGCSRLASEFNDLYQDKQSLAPKERLAIISRVATYMILNNRSGIWGNDTEEFDTKLNLRMDDIVGDVSSAETNAIKIQRIHLREVLNTSIFKLSGPTQTLTFKHRTYSEFLCALHVHELKISTGAIQHLFCSSVENGRVIPQLEEVVVWIATMDPAVLKVLARTEPFLMLRVHRPLSGQEKHDICTGLLEVTGNYELTDDYAARKFYHKLSGGKLNSLLNRVLRHAKNTIATRVAINVAGAIREPFLIDPLVILASDDSLSPYLRKEAINSIAEIGTARGIEFLSDLFLHQSQDLDDDINGTLLRHLYPGNISITQVLTCLNKPWKRSHYDSYRSFIDALPDVIPERDLEAALYVVVERGEAMVDCNSHVYDTFLQKFTRRCWPLVTTANPAAAMAKVLEKLYHAHVPFDVPDESGPRRLVAQEYIFNATSSVRPYEIVGRIYNQGNPLLNSNDIKWMLDLLAEPIPDYASRYLVQTLKYYSSFIQNSPSDIANQVLELAFERSEIAHEFGPWLLPIDLDSQAALDMRENFRLSREGQVNTQDQVVPIEQIQKVSDIVMMHLKRFEEGSSEDWWRLIHAMGASDNGAIERHNDFLFDVTKLNGWSRFVSEMEDRFQHGCIKCIQTSGVPDTAWISTDRYNRPELAVYKALLFLRIKNDPFVETLTASFWSQWAEIICYCTLNSFGEDIEPMQNLLEVAYKHESAGCISFIKRHLHAKVLDGKDIHDLHRVNRIIDNRFASDMFSILTGSFAAAREVLLGIAFSRGLTVARNIAIEDFNSLYNGGNVSNGYLFRSASYLIVYPDQLEWDSFWAKLIRKPLLANKIILRGAHAYSHGHRADLNQFTSAQLGTIAIWLYRYFPPFEDPVHDTAYSPTSRDDVADFRNSIIHHLIETGSSQSVQALESLAGLYPNDENLKLNAIFARTFWRKNSWTPFSPDELQLVLANANRRIIRSEGDLLFTIQESLQRLQAKLQGNNPSALFLWNEIRKGKYKPKDENAFTDFIKLHLDYDLRESGVIVNREVEIRKSTGRKDGQRTDLYIQTINNDNKRTLTVVVEVKGCWNEEMDTAMETQLCGRYLAKYKGSFGLYLVGWFYCSHYSPSKGGNRQKVEENLRAQADRLTKGERKINFLILDCSI